MKKLLFALFLQTGFAIASFAQAKTLIGILPFNSSSEQSAYGRNAADPHAVSIEDAISDAFLATRRFTLVERAKMSQLKTEKELQKGEDFVDGSVVEQSKSLGAQYIVTGNITKATAETKTQNIPFVGVTTTQVSEISFSMKVVDVSTGEIIASNSFHGSAKGKTCFDEALKQIKPEIEKFITDNFKVTASVAEIEEKAPNGDATKVLIAAGSAIGLKLNDEFKVYEITELNVDGKKMMRKKTIGKIAISKVEDENFSECIVKEGGSDIAAKVASGKKVKCEILN